MNTEEQEALRRIMVIQWRIYDLEYDRCMALHKEIVEFLIKARDENTGVSEDVILWHKLAGSTPKPTSAKRLDYDSPWSVLEFMLNLEKREGL